MKTKIFFALLMLCPIISWAAKVNTTFNIQVNGETRKYWLYVPDNVKNNTPLVFCLHGTGGSCENNSPNFNSIADKEGLIAVYPQGKTIYFPVFGGNFPGWHSTGEYSEDIDFFKAIIEVICDKYSVNRKRIYCCGFSNGGMMTYTVANLCSDIFAAFASISGYPINEFHLHHTSWRPIPYLHIHGKADDFVKYSLVPNIIDDMVARNGANPVPTVTEVSGKYKKSVYAETDGGFPVVFYEIEGMGHSDYTANTEDGNSSQTMWNFMKKYTLDSQCDTTLKWRPNIEQEGWTPRSHGWTLYSGKILCAFGLGSKTDANQNVYRSLQFENGYYQVRLKAKSNSATKVVVKLQRLTTPKAFTLNDTIDISDNMKVNFKVTEGWGEYRFTIASLDTADEITLSNIEIHSITEVEASSIKNVKNTLKNDYKKGIYSLAGFKTNKQNKGINIVDGRKVYLK